MSDESEQDPKGEQTPASRKSGGDVNRGQRRKLSPLVRVFATGMIVLHHRKYRRNVLFGLTLAMLVMVSLGSLLFGEALAGRPVVFAIYWAVCFVLLFAVLALALYDLMRVRGEHQMEMRRLEARMSADMEKLRVEAEAEEEAEAEAEVEQGEAKGDTDRAGGEGRGAQS